MEIENYIFSDEDIDNNIFRTVLTVCYEIINYDHYLEVSKYILFNLFSY